LKDSGEGYTQSALAGFSGGRFARARYGLSDFAAADAAGAGANALACAFDHRLYRTKIHIPTPFGDVMGVADVVSKLRPLAADIAYSCHDNCSRTYFQLQPKLFREAHCRRDENSVRKI